MLVQSAVMDYFSALAELDGDRACARLTPRMQRQAVDETGEASCAEGIEALFAEAPRDLRAVLSDVEINGVGLEGATAIAELLPDDRYASESRTPTVLLRYVDGEWRIDGLPDDAALQPDPVSICVVGGIRAFNAGEADPLWEREGRADFVTFIRRVCRRGVKQGGEQPSASEVRRLQTSVLRDMVRSGRIRDPG